MRLFMEMGFVFLIELPICDFELLPKRIPASSEKLRILRKSGGRKIFLNAQKKFENKT